ncbi:MAG TPA: DMT family protein, partial [Bacillota bacterium]|nr:DMT family protein [Bacillota bacterium]
RELKWFENLGLVTIVLISWGIALFEYFAQVPANRIGYKENGGPFTLVELKVIQEVISLSVFMSLGLVSRLSKLWFRPCKCSCDSSMNTSRY